MPINNILNNFPSPYGLGYPTGTPVNNNTANNYYTPYGGGANPNGPLIQPLNNFPSPYSMGYDSSVPVINNTRNDFASPYSMGQPGSYSGGYSAQQGYAGALPNYGTSNAASQLMLSPNQPAGTTPLAGGTPQNTSTGGTNMPTGNPPNFNLNPNPTVGQGAYGLVPGTIGAPPSTFQQTVGAVPGLGDAATSQLTNNIMAELQGQIDPQSLRNMQDEAARFGVSSGMPGSNAYLGSLANNKNLLGNILTSQQLKQQGGKDYLSALSGIGGQQLSPALLAEIAAHNAQLRAAPDPQTAAERMLNNYYNALNRSRSPAGGTGQQDPFGMGGAGGLTGGGALGFGFGSLGRNPAAGNQVGSYAGDVNPETGEPFGGSSGGYGGVNPETGYGPGGTTFGTGSNTYDPYGFWNDFGLGSDNTQYDNPEWDFYGG